MRKALLTMALLASFAAVPAGADQVCWYQEFSGAYCLYETPAGLHVRTQPSNVSVWGSGLRVTGVAIAYTTPPGIRIWIDGQQFGTGPPQPPPASAVFHVCWYTGLAAETCVPVPGLPVPGVVRVRTQVNHLSVDGSVAGVPIPYTGAVVAYSGKPSVRVMHDGREHYVFLP